MSNIRNIHFSHQLVDLPLYLVEPVILTTILYWMVGLNSDVGRFFVACGIVLLVTQVTQFFIDFIFLASLQYTV